jgi:hypothetical protein
MNPQDFVQGPAPNQWMHKDGTLFVGRPGQTLEQVIAEYTSALNAPEVPQVPQTVTPRQARLALNKFGLRQQVDNWVAAQSQDVRDTWDYATQVVRTDTFITQAATALGLSDAQLDALFTTAAAL